MRCRVFAVVLGAIPLVFPAVGAAAEESFLNLGPSDETNMLGPGDDACSEGTLVHHHEGACDDALCWQFAGIAPPYYGAFAEAYDLGAGTVHCGAFWVTTLGDYAGHPTDLYIWEGGVAGIPGGVVAMVGGHVFDNVPWWPTCGQNDVEMEVCVDGAFTVGCWADFSDESCQYYVARDLDGPEGCPWTNVAPGIGFPTGWQHPDIFWEYTRSLMIGVYFSEGGTPVAPHSWGRIKDLLR